MQLSTHLRLALRLADKLALSGASRAAFLYGNIHPDLFLPTHLTRKPHEHLEGHSFDFAGKKVLRLIEELKTAALSADTCYRLGKLCHYTADCFTWPHNPGYPGSLSAHISYESILDKRFADMQTKPCDLPAKITAPEAFFLDAHTAYLKEEPSLYRDLSYILAVTERLAFSVGGVCRGVWAEKPVPAEARS